MAKVTEIRVEVGGTENMGDYTNVKVSFSLMAELSDGDDAAEVLADLQTKATAAYRAQVDDERELHGLTVRYYDGPLYHVRKSAVRECVVIFPDHVKLPEESNWKERDSWSMSYGSADHLRIEKARSMALQKAGSNDFLLIDCSDGDLTKLPPLPDPGPEPAWHQKGIEDILRNMNIPKDEWEELATLDHVDRDWIYRLWAESGRENAEFYIQHIRDGVLPEPEPEEEEPEPYDDIDYDDDDYEEYDN